MNFDQLMEFMDRGRKAQAAVNEVIAEHDGKRAAQRRRAGKKAAQNPQAREKFGIPRAKLSDKADAISGRMA